MNAGNSRPPEFEPTDQHRKRRDLVEICVGYTLILAVIWAPRPWQRILYFPVAAVLVTILLISFPGWTAMGLRTTNLARSIWIAGVSLLMAAIAILIAARCHTLQWPGGPRLFLHRYLGYAIWAFFQQILLQDFFLLRLLRLSRNRFLAALLATAIFSLAHLPSPILFVVTFVWGLAACLLFLRYRNLYPLALAHAVFGITIAMTIPGPVTHNMRVGLGYLSYSQHHPHLRIR